MGDGRVGERYAIDGGVDGKRRLNLLAEIMRPTTLALLDRVGVGDGLHCLDLGCGGGHVAIDMARRVGAAGRVVGVDFDATVIELARADAVRPDRISGEVAAARAHRTTFVDTTDWFCTPTDCPVVIGDLLVLRDETHLTPPMAEFLTPLLAAALAPVFGAGG